jgi:glucose-1-phosphate adenylyltransferase
MGIYIFRAEVLLDILKQDEKPDFGHDILPYILDKLKVIAYPYIKQNRIGDMVVETDESGNRNEVFNKRARDSGYWRDVGTLDAYWNANMDLTGVDPYFNMYGRLWPIRTNQRQFPPVKTVFAQNNSEHPRMAWPLIPLLRMAQY